MDNERSLMRTIRRLAPGALLALAAFAPLAAQTTAPDLPRAFRGFGTSVVMHQGELYVGRIGQVIGYPYPMPSSEAGSVHRFRRAADGTWTEAAVLKAADAAVGDGFGRSVAISGSRMAVGAPDAGVGGAVYLFELQGAEWRQVARLALADGAATDRLGAVVALDGDYLLVGTPGRNARQGAVHASRRSATGWSPLALVVEGAAAGDAMGSAIGLAGAVAIVGAPGFGGVAGAATPPAGRALTLHAGPQGWRPAEALATGTDTTGAFGSAVLLQGDEAFVAAPASQRAVGTVYHYRRQGDGWTQVARIDPPVVQPGSSFGMGLARSGATLMVGAPTSRGGVGAVHIYRSGNGDWTAGQQLTVPPSGLGVLFGLALAVDGDAAVVGGPMGELFEGSGFAYSRNPATNEWTPDGMVADRSTRLNAITGGEHRCEAGKASDFGCQEVDLLAYLPLRDVGGERGTMANDIWGWTDSTSRREFAIMGRTNGTAFIEVTDPSRPVYLGDLPLHEGARPNLWRDIKVYRDHAFIVADGAGPHGMQVFNLRRLLRTAGPPATFTEDAHYDRIASAHNIAINEATGFAYAIGASGGGETCGGALHMIDIRGPTQPSFAGCFGDPSTGRARTGYTHDNQCVTYAGPDTRFTGREICFNASETAVGIADVTDKANPKALGVGAYPNLGYAHQGWLTEDHRYYYLNDELDEVAGTVSRTRTLVWDVQKLDEPVLAREFLGATGASDHNLYVRGNYMFQSNYVAGLRVIDISDPANPRETGHFDTVPWGDDTPGFAGSWSNFPYFPSGTIVVSSMREGLFVLRHRPRPLVP
jgi:choice-of-anchor B domain-containing protein